MFFFYCCQSVEQFILDKQDKLWLNDQNGTNIEWQQNEIGDLENI